MNINKYEFKEFTQEEVPPDEKRASFLIWLSQNMETLRQQPLTLNQIIELFDTWVWTDPEGGLVH
jgi:hypothetical protein